MSDDPNTAADLFAEDIMRIVLTRLQVRLSPLPYGQIQVQLVDGHTGHCFISSGPQLSIKMDTIKVKGVVTDVFFNMREG